MLNANEKRVLLEFIDQLIDYQSNAGCNDFELDNTDENWELLKAVERYSFSDPKDWTKRRPNKDKKIGTPGDFIVLDYLKSLLEKE